METSGGIQASLSGRYATALFELARDAKTIDTVEGSLANVRAALEQSDEFARLVASPLVSRKDAAASVAASAAAMGIDATTKNFLGVLAENRRLAQLPAIIRAFRTLAADYRGETTAEVVSAHPLSASQVDALKQQLRTRIGRDVSVDLSVDALKQQLRTRIGRDVSVDLSVDPALLGGLIVKIGSQMIDSSIRTRLNTLAHAMKG